MNSVDCHAFRNAMFICLSGPVTSQILVVGTPKQGYKLVPNTDGYWISLLDQETCAIMIKMTKRTKNITMIWPGLEPGTFSAPINHSEDEISC